MKKLLSILAAFTGLAFSQLCTVEIGIDGVFHSDDHSSCKTGPCTINLPNTARIIYMRPSPCHDGQSISGGFEDTFLPVGTSTYTVNANGTNYTINIVRAANGSANTVKTLSGLQVSHGAAIFELNPAFAAATVVYNVDIPFKTESVKITGVHGFEFGGVEYLDADSKRISNEDISLPVGLKVLKVRALAESKAAGYTDYTLNLTRAEGNTNANLGSFEVFLNGNDFENVLEDFHEDKLNYTLNVPNAITKATVKATKEDQYFGEFVGAHSWIDRTLNVCNNSFPVTVKPEVGPNKVYRLTIVRACPSDDPDCCVPPEEPSSSSGGGGSSSSGGDPSSSSSDKESPIRIPKAVTGPVSVQVANGAIVLGNLPSNARIEVYSLNGKRIYFANPENPKIQANQGSDNLSIQVQAKGIYVVKINNTVVRVPVVM